MFFWNKKKIIFSLKSFNLPSGFVKILVPNAETKQVWCEEQNWDDHILYLGASEHFLLKWGLCGPDLFFQHIPAYRKDLWGPAPTLKSLFKLLWVWQSGRLCFCSASVSSVSLKCHFLEITVTIDDRCIKSVGFSRTGLVQSCIH